MSPAGAVVCADTGGWLRGAFFADVRLAVLVAGPFAAVFFVAGAVVDEGLRAAFLVAVPVDGEAVLLTAAFFRVVEEIVFVAIGLAAADVRDDVVAFFGAALVVAAFFAAGFVAAGLVVAACAGARSGRLLGVRFADSAVLGVVFFGPVFVDTVSR